LGNLLKERGRFEDALIAYTKAIELKPDDYNSHTNQGTVLQELGKLNEAEAAFIKAISLKPNFAEAHNNLGSVRCMLGNIDAGLKAFRAAEEIDPRVNNNKFMSIVMEARRKSGWYKACVGDRKEVSTGRLLSANPLILSRAIEDDLISTLYKVDSSSLDMAPGPRYGNGRCSPDYNLFQLSSPVIRQVADDLTSIMAEAVNTEIFVQDSFFNIFSTDAGIGPHRHVNLLDRDKNLQLEKYSLVYYLSVGDQDCSEPGVLHFFDPDEQVLPVNEMIVIFPASRLHSAAYGGKADRIMIGANFYSL
jgi:tetratricopeptide (TPR) repeat protein